MPQEDPFGSTRYEGTASFTGTCEGKEVTGENYAEMVVNWSDCGRRIPSRADRTRCLYALRVLG
jgi:hypothetical protein